MATQKICDRCGSKNKVEKNELIEFFNGILAIDNVDLCEKCFQIFAKLLNKFANREKREVKE